MYIIYNLIIINYINVDTAKSQKSALSGYKSHEICKYN